MTIVIAIFCFEAVASAILRGPSNVAVVAGTNMTMTCEPTPGTNTVDWYHTQVRSKDIIPTLLRINHGSRIQKNFSEFSVEGKIPGELLYLKVTQLKHAGFYQCTATGQKATAQLVVLASEPRCNVSSHVIKEEVTRVDLFCSVSYNGYWIPVMEWSQTSVGNTSARDIPINDYVIDSLENELTSYLSLVINSSTKGFRYSCKTYFKNISSNQTSTTASNTPKYESIWISPVIEMLYGPKTVTVFPMKGIFHPGDVLLCSADSNLSSEFEWTDMETGTVFKGSTIVINTSMVRDEPYSFSCKAINKLTRAYVKSSLFTFTVMREHGENESTTTDHERAENSAGEIPLKVALIISAAATSAVMSIAFAGCLIVFRKKRKRKLVSQKEHENPGTVTPPKPTAEDTSTIYAVAMDSSSTQKSVDVQPISLGEALSGSYEEIDTESEGTKSSCYNLGNTSEEHKLPQNDEDFGSSKRTSNSSDGSKETVKSIRYEDLLERDPVKPSVYLRLMQSQKEQETQTSNSPTSSENSTQSQAIYVNIRKPSSKFSVKA